MTKKEIQEKNDKIVKTVFKIMDILHDPKTGFDALRPKLRKLTKNDAEYEKAKNDILKSFVDKIIYTKTIANHKHHSGRDDASVEIFLKI
jgi:hypothetical protein